MDNMDNMDSKYTPEQLAEWAAMIAAAAAATTEPTTPATTEPEDLEDTVDAPLEEGPINGNIIESYAPKKAPGVTPAQVDAAFKRASSVEVIPSKVGRRGIATARLLAATGTGPTSAVGSLQGKIEGDAFADTATLFPPSTRLLPCGTEVARGYLADVEAQRSAEDVCRWIETTVTAERRSYVDFDVRDMRFAQAADGSLRLTRGGGELPITRSGFLSIADRLRGLHKSTVTGTGYGVATKDYESQRAPLASPLYMLGRHDTARLVSMANADLDAFTAMWKPTARRDDPIVRLHTRIRKGPEAFAMTGPGYLIGTGAATAARALRSELEGSGAKAVGQYGPDTTDVEIMVTVAPGSRYADSVTVGDGIMMQLRLRLNDAGHGGGSADFGTMIVECINCNIISAYTQAARWRHVGGDAKAAQVLESLRHATGNFSEHATRFLREWGVMAATPVNAVPMRIRKGRPEAAGPVYATVEDALQGLAPSVAVGKAFQAVYDEGSERDAEGSWKQVANIMTRAAQDRDDSGQVKWWREIEELSGLLIPVIARAAA